MPSTRHDLFAALLLLASSAPLAAQLLPRIPGYNIGFDPNAMISVTTYAGKPALWIVIPGSGWIASFYDPRNLPANTTKVTLQPVQWGIYEPQSCGIGAKIYFDTQYPIGTVPISTVTTTGWNTFGNGWAFYYAGDPFYSTWQLTYCSAVTCSSPCGGSHINPQYEAYLCVPTFS